MTVVKLSYVIGLCSVVAFGPQFALADEAPTALNLNSILKEDTSKKITLKGKASKGKKLSFDISQPQHGTLVLNKAKTVATYKPTSNYNGSDSFQFTATDGTLSSAPATATLKIQSVNDAPVATPQSFVVKKGATATINLTADDVVEHDALTYIITAKPKVGNALAKPVGKTVNYTPRKASYDRKGKLKKPDFSGADSFSFKVKDAGKPAKTSKVVKIKLTVRDKCLDAKQLFIKGVCTTINKPPVCPSPKVPKNDQCVDPVTSCAEPEKLQNNICVIPEANPQLTVINLGQGYIKTETGEINCDDACSAIFVQGASVKLSATSKDTSTFANWGGNCTGTLSPECSFQLYASTVVTATFAPRFNDTGVTSCSDANNNGLTCSQTSFPRQDAQYGRDAIFNVDSNGHAGFNFTKIDSAGNTTTGPWSCVKDNVTGLMWEAKTNDGGLHDLRSSYSWYQPDASKNGGNAGKQNGGASCIGSACDTDAYVQAVNASGWCGHTDWRLPTRKELLSLVNLDAISPAIDTAFFPYTSTSWYWTSSPTANSINALSPTGEAWSVGFNFGDSPPNDKSSGINYIRLVRKAN